MKQQCIAILLCAFICFGCEQLRSGNVTSKKYHQAYDEIILMPNVVFTGKTTTTVLVPYYVHHNQSWSISVRGIGTKGNELSKTFYVDKAAYDTLNIGHFICADGMCMEDTAIHKTKK